MAHSVQDLVRNSSLGLQIIVTGDDIDRDLEWVVSTDLVDPVQFFR